MKLCLIKELQDLFVDACVRDSNGQLMFLSSFGRDGAIQQLIAAIHLGSAKGGLRNFTLVDPSAQRDLLPVTTDNPDRLVKFTGRLPKENLFGHLTQAWIYDAELMKPARGTGTGWVLIDERTEANALEPSLQRARIWQMYQQISTIPLLDHWQETILDITPECVIDLSKPPFPTFGRVRAWKIVLADNFSELISHLVARRVLRLMPSESLAQAN